MNAKALQKQVPPLTPLLADASHVDVKMVDSPVSMREFIAGMFSYYPGWIKNLYRIRWAFVRLLGMKQAGVPQTVQMKPEDVPMTPGEKAAFFTVKLAEDGRYWVAGITESHLTAHLGVVMESLTTGNRFYVITIVHYRNWAGPVYFNVIRPFHHLVVARMAQAGARTPSAFATKAAPSATGQ
jgi:hypothetical protein